MNETKADETRAIVRDHYGKIAKTGGGCPPGCCGAPPAGYAENQAAALAGCVSGAAPIDDVRAMLQAAGFTEIEVRIAPQSADVVGSWLPGIERFVASATIEARKPGPQAKTCCGPECCA